MKRLAIVVSGLLHAAGCSSSSSTPPSTPAGTTTTRVTAAMQPSQETPAPISNSENSSSGTATIDFVITRDATGAITAATANFQVNTAGFPGSTTTLTAAHIHTGAVGVGGGILIDTGVKSDVSVSGGAATFTRNGITMTAANAQSILDNPAGFYFNVHTPANPGGVMRAQLVKQ